MRVLQVSAVSTAGDPEPEALLEAWPTLPAVARAAAGDGVEVEVLAAAGRDAVLEDDGVVFRFAAVPAMPGPLRALAAARILARRAAALRPDLVHLHGLDFPVHARLLGEAVPGAPLLVQDHKSRVPLRRRRWLHRWGLAGVAGVAFTAREMAEPFRAARVLPPDVAVFEILEGSSRFTPGDPAAARARAGLAGSPCLLWVGRLDRNKDPFTVLDAFARALPALPDARLWCCFTAAPLLGRVRERIAAEPALRERVRLLGAVPHETVEDLCRAADFLLLGSRFEGSGYAVLEALACGATPVVTDIPAFRRITRGGAVGALVPPGDAAGMARALIELAGRDRAALRAAARRHFERFLSFETLGAELRAAYRVMAGGRGRPAPGGAGRTGDRYPRTPASSGARPASRQPDRPTPGS